MATTSQRGQKFLAKNQTNKVLPLVKCPTTKETLILPRDLHEIYAYSTVTYAGYEEECVLITIDLYWLISQMYLYQCPAKL